MPGEITRPTPMYMQVADALAQAIKAGEYEPGRKLPSETELIERYGISRLTVRSAIAELRTMGLVESRQGQGSFVRQSAPTSAIARKIVRSGKRFSVPEMTEAEKPAVTRIHIIGTHAELLGRREEDAADAFSVDRLLTDPATGARISQRVIIPLDVAAEAPVLGDAPDTSLPDLYAHLAEAGHELSWQEYVTARTPLPDERQALGLSDSSPILITYRVTYGTDDRPLLCEELHTSAARSRLVYQINPEKAPAKRPRKAQS
ncbi:GntR family transcriptional regulator [Streptomyces sp. NPDC101150]|uniref:GntR family transcriptional regulator n=1 Tax=Streptomyces sp. NPDC101150 TaxID=3366114 RepID=UPI00381E4AAA